jgi:FOG: FHA domain
MKKQTAFHTTIIRAGLCLALALAFLTPLKVQAQDTQPSLPVSTPDTSNYPTLSFYFWPIDSSGNFVGSLTNDQVHVLENDREVKLDSLNLIEPGTHVVLAVNQGTTLANSYAGKSRMDRMKEVIDTWIKSESITTMDDFSLVTNDTVVETELTTPSDWVKAMDDYTPDLRKSTPSLNSLSQAMALIKDIPSSDHKSKAILYITPLPDTAQLAGLPDQVSAAKAAGARLFIWLVGPQSYANDPAAATLQQAAKDTSGSFFLFSGAETLPDLNTYLSPLSHEYEATYTTSLQKSGSFTLQVQIEQTAYQASSEKVSFDLKAQAPNPIFLDPPQSITLDWVKPKSGKVWGITPNQATIKYMLEFPDGHKRTITSARLFVDGKLAADVANPTENQLSWDLSGYTETGTHLLQITVQDNAGFNASTIKTPVLVTVNPKPQTAFQKFLEGINFTTLGIVAFLVLLAAGLLVFYRRRFLKNQEGNPVRRVEDNDPVKQAVLIDQSDSAGLAGPDTPADWPKLPGAGKALARLLPVVEGSDTRPTRRQVPLSLQDTSFGSDSMRNDVVLTGVTIAPVHAKIFTDAAKHFFIADCGSAAGTWVNYAPVSQQGARLQHGDLINIGAYSFRFEEINPEGRPIQVLPYNRE